MKIPVIWDMCGTGLSHDKSVGDQGFGRVSTVTPDSWAAV